MTDRPAAPPAPPAPGPPAPPWALLLGLGLLTAALALGLALGPLGGVPHVSDEIAYTLQARLFAAGQRMAAAAPHPALQSYPFWQTTGATFAVFPPGWPALLGLGERFGLGVLVNPLLAAGLPAVAWGLAQGRLRPRGARLAAVLMALSPGVLLLASSRMAHTSVLLALGLGALAAARPGARGWTGLAVAYVVLARPFDAVLVGLPLLIWAAWRATGPQRAALVLLPGLAAALVFADNHATTGAALTFPVGPWYDAWVADLGRPPGCNRLGFGETVGCAPVGGSWGHSPAKALAALRDTATRLDSLLIGVPGGLLLAAAGAWRLGRRGLWLWLPLLLVPLGHMLYWSPGLALGARFWHPLHLALPLLIAHALDRIPGRLVAPGLAALCLVGTSRLLPELADSWWCVDDALKNRLAAEGIDHGVLFVRSEGRPQRRAWPRLGVAEGLECAPMLEAGDAFLLHDPTGAGLTVRHAPSPPSQIARWRAAEAPTAPAHLAVQDLATGQWRIERLPALAP